jgi:3-oxoacyl-[acyl-carrier protein] reductase
VTRKVVVSGGGSGIGRACAEWFAARGDEVFVVGRREINLRNATNAMGVHTHYIVADLSTVTGAEIVRERIAPEGVDVIVCAAGGTAAKNPTNLKEIAHEWSSDLDQNLMTSVLLVEALRENITRPGGRVIGIGSIGAQLGSGYGGSYGAAKAAMHGWMYWLAQNLGEDGVTANLVNPGFIPETEFFGERMNPDFYNTRVQRSLVKRAGTLNDVADTVGFLASAQASYITGQIIGVSGGTVLGR